MSTPAVDSHRPQLQDELPALTVRCGEQTYPITQSPATIGRGSNSTVHLDYSWLSRTHLTLDLIDGTWVATDTSTHGIFVNNERVTTVPITNCLEVNLGATDGLTLVFTAADTPNRDLATTDPTREKNDTVPAHEAHPNTDATDPGLIRVGAAITARRRELGFTQEEFATQKIIGTSSLIAIEKGRSWPHASTRTKLEKKLQWAPGTIENIRSGLATPASDETTQVINPDAQVSMLARTIGLALKRIDTAVADLPEPTAPGFLTAAEGIHADLKELRGIAEDAAENHQTPVVELATTLLSIRRRIDDLLALTARSPHATLGRRLQVLRRQRGLNVDDIALMARLPAAVILQAEAEQPISTQDHATLSALVAQIA